MTNKSLLKIQIPAKKKNKNRHPPGGYYWGPDHPHGTPKKYDPKRDEPPSVNV